MRFLKYSIVAVAALTILSVTAQATPQGETIPDTTSTMSLLGCAFAGLASLRAWLKK